MPTRKADIHLPSLVTYAVCVLSVTAACETIPVASVVHFSIAADAVRALSTLQGHLIDGRSLSVEYARRRLPQELKKKEGAGAGAGAAAGEDANADADSDADGDGDADDSSDGDSEDGDDDAAKAKISKPKSQRATNVHHEVAGRTVIVGGLAKDTTKKHIYKRFKKIGSVDLKSIELMLSSGEASVTFDTHKVL